MACRFLWVKIQVDRFMPRIRSQRTRLASDIEKRLASLESFSDTGEKLLKDAYDAEYARATGGEDEHGRREAVVSALRWVLSAFRPLTLRELAYAASINHQDGSASRGAQEGELLEFCSNLLVQDSTGIMQVAHLSVREYLERRMPPEFALKTAHAEAALTSLYFKQSRNCIKELFRGSAVIQQGHVALTKGFYEYVEANWARHCQQASDDPLVKAMLDRVTKSAEEQVPARGKDAPVEDKTLENHGGLGKDNGPGLAGDTPDPGSIDTFQDFPNWITALHYGTFHKINMNEEIARYITRKVARNADLNNVDYLGDTILHRMVKVRFGAAVGLLIQGGAAVSAQNYAGNTPLHEAAIYGFDEGARQLLIAHTDRNARNAHGQTALHLSIVHKSSAVFETLLSAGVDCLARDHHQSTAFHYAAQWESLDAVKSLLFAGYNPDGINDNRDTSLSIAVKSGNLEMIRELVHHRAVVREEDVAAVATVQVSEALSNGSGVIENEFSSPDRTMPEDTVVKLLDGSSLGCTYCHIGRWFRLRSGVAHAHAPSLEELRLSAATCCLCAFFDEEASQQYPGVYQSDNSKLTATVRLASDRPWDKSGRDTLSVALNDEASMTWEICYDSRKGLYCLSF